MYRSGRVRLVDGDTAPRVTCLIMYPLSYTVLKSSCATAWWLRVVVRVKRSYESPSAARSSTITRLYRSASSRADTPSFSACTRIGVPCSSVPETMSTSCPAIRMYRLNTSEGTPKPET